MSTNYTEEEYLPAGPLQGPLNWANGDLVTSPLQPPAPDIFGRWLTSTTRVDFGVSGVDAIVGHELGRR